MTAEELRLHRQRLLGLLLLLASVLLGARSEGTWGNFICLASGDLRDSVSAVQVPSGPSLRLGRMAGTFCLRWVHPYFIFSKEHVSTILWRLP